MEAQTDAAGNEVGKLFVGGLSQQTTNDGLRQYFAKFGEVDEAAVMMDNRTNRSRGFGYVRFKDPNSIELVINSKMSHVVDGKEVDPKQCNVNMKGKNRRSLKIFVGGIAPECSDEQVKSFFSQFGNVTDVNLMMDISKQRHRGFAFVGFDDEATVKRLIQMHFVNMNGKQVEVKAMEPPNFGKRMQGAPGMGGMPGGRGRGRGGTWNAANQGWGQGWNNPAASAGGWPGANAGWGQSGWEQNGWNQTGWTGQSSGWDQTGLSGNWNNQTPGAWGNQAGVWGGQPTSAAGWDGSTGSAGWSGPPANMYGGSGDFNRAAQPAGHSYHPYKR